MSDTSLRCCECGNTVAVGPDGGDCGCGFQFSASDGEISYDYKRLLYQRYGRRYLRNRVLNNNGTVSYIEQKGGSLSLPQRPDVQRFRAFMDNQGVGTRILDVGSGSLDLPGYLAFGDGRTLDLCAIDPIENSGFRGTKVVGCAEFIPFADGSFDTVVFATSLDHVVSIRDSLREARRVLKDDGRLFVWMSDRSLRGIVRRAWARGSLLRFAGALSSHVTPRLRCWRDTLAFYLFGRVPEPPFEPYRLGRYVIYSNYSVFWVPRGGVDAFHGFAESPQAVVRQCQRVGLKVTAQDVERPNECFLSFAKSS